MASLTVPITNCIKTFEVTYDGDEELDMVHGSTHKSRLDPNIEWEILSRCKPKILKSMKITFDIPSEYFSNAMLRVTGYKLNEEGHKPWIVWQKYFTIQ